MKQVFECGIVVEANNEVGDSMMAAMLGITLPPMKDRKLPDDFTLELQEHDLVRNGIGGMNALLAAYDSLKASLIERGYTCYEWRDNDKWCHCYRFKRDASRG